MILATCLIFLFVQGAFCCEGDHRQNICITDKCFKTSRNIFSSIDWNVSSCDDFYERACGTWIKTTDIPAPYAEWGHADVLRNKVLKDLRDILKESPSSTDTVTENRTKIFYRSCMNTAAMDQAGSRVLRNIVQQSGGWPMIDTDHDTPVEEKSWEKAHTYYSRLTGIGGLVTIHVISNVNTNNVPIISLNQPDSVYGKYRSLGGSTYERLYKHFIKNVAAILIKAKMANVSNASVENDVNDVLQFRSHLQQIIDRQVQTEKAEDDLNTIEALQNFTDLSTGQQTTINWLTFIKNCFPRQVIDTINSTEEIFIQERQYIERLIPLLKSTAPRTIINHIQLYTVERYLEYTDLQLRTLAQNINSAIVGSHPTKKRWKTCVKGNKMKHILSNMYVKKHFPRTSKDKVTVMANNLRDVLVDHINQSQWLDKDTKREALLKVERMQIEIGYPDWYDDETKLQNYYNGQGVSTNYLRNIINYMGNEHRIELLKLRNLEPRQTSDSYPIDVNAYYSIVKNSVLVHAAFLQWPYYTEGGPDAVNYASAGSIIAHEMGHAFDTIGRKLNSLGQLEDWWSTEASAVYDSNVDCIKSMYNNFTAPEVEPPLQMNNSVLTVDEDIADIIGLRVAYDAFHKSVNDTPRVCLKTILGFDWSSIDSLFFHSYASTYCAVLDPNEIVNMMWEDVHNFARFRVNGPIMLMPEFEDSFSCPAGSPMSPTESCTFWDT